MIRKIEHLADERAANVVSDRRILRRAARSARRPHADARDASAAPLATARGVSSAGAEPGYRNAADPRRSNRALPLPGAEPPRETPPGSATYRIDFWRIDSRRLPLWTAERSRRSTL